MSTTDLNTVDLNPVDSTPEDHVRRANDRGATLPIVAAMVVPMVIMVALVVDIGAKRQQEAQAQAAVDAAALASTYSVASIDPGNLDAAALMAHRKVEENFKLDPGGWATCTDPDHLSELPPGVAGECVSFDSSGVNPVARVKLPPVKMNTFFGGIIGVDEMSVISAGGADGSSGPGGSSTSVSSPGSTASVPAGPTTTISPGAQCISDFEDNFWNDIRGQVESTVNSVLSANNNADGVWWDGSAATSSAPSTAISVPIRIPPGCEGEAGMDQSSWDALSEDKWPWHWKSRCHEWFVANQGSIPTGVCGFTGHYGTYDPGPTSTSIPATSAPGSGGPTTSGDITLG